MQRSVSRSSLWILALLLFVATSSVASAEAPEGKAVPAEVAPEAATTCATGAPDVVWTLAGIGAQSDCTADCWDGSSVTCDQGTSCSATDSACMAERGHCWDNFNGYQYCPECVESCPEPTCDQLHGQSCKTGTTCYGWPPSCLTYSCNCWNGTLICP